MRSTALASLLLLCACRPADPPAVAWHRVDLWQQTPSTVATADGEPLAGGYELVHIPLGNQVGAYRGAAAVRAVETAPGVRLGWSAHLGVEPYFSFVPLLDMWNCSYRYHVGVRTGSGIRVLSSNDVVPTRVASSTLTVTLEEFADSDVELLVQADALPGCAVRRENRRLRYGSPAIYSRRNEEPSRLPAGDRINVLLLTVDTLRADALGAYGGAPSVTPALDRLAGESDVFLEAFSSFNVTNPSFASLMTGLYGKNHGIYDLKTPLPETATTLAELFSAGGWATRSIVAIGHLNREASGLGQGFVEFTDAPMPLAAELPVDLAVDWLQESRTQPFFLWLHLFDPHTPHTPPAPYALGRAAAAATGMAPPQGFVPFRAEGEVAFEERRLGGHRDLYAGEVAYVDRQIDRLLDFLRSSRRLDSTLVAFVADHGENLDEHGIRFRHAGLWDTTTRVPLLIRWPGRHRAGRRIEGLVQHLDLFPTLLAAARLQVPPSDGRDLHPLVAGEERGRRVVFAEHAERQGIMVRSREFLYMRSEGSPFVADGPHLYDLRNDPEQVRNLAGRGLEEEERLAALLERWLTERDPLEAATARELSEEEKERLRSLGYL